MMSIKEAAAWMAREVADHYTLDESHAAAHIRQIFGEAFVYRNRDGERAVNPAVLHEFEKLTRDTVVWSGERREWRQREPNDDPGRGQA